MINTAECTSVEQELIKHSLVHAIRLGRDGRFLAEHDVPRCGRVRRKQSPVHEPLDISNVRVRNSTWTHSVSQIRILRLFRRQLEDLRQQLLGSCGSPYEELYGRCEQSKLYLPISTRSDMKRKAHLCGFFSEGEYKVFQQLVTILDSVGILSHDPNHSCFGFWFVQHVQVFA